MSLRALAVLIVGLIAAPAVAQAPIPATTESGQKVLLYPDGTWKFVNQPPAVSPGLKSYVKSPTATERLLIRDDKIVINFDPQKWKKSARPEEPGSCGFTM